MSNQTTTEGQPLDAEFVEDQTPNSVIPRYQVSHIRRAPRPGQSGAVARISMELDDWLDVDRRLHELYGLCEIAIQQRDHARSDMQRAQSEAIESQTRADKFAARLIEWKTYARKLEERLHEAQLEALAAQHRAARAADVAESALDLGVFDRKRSNELRQHFEDHQLSE